MSYSRPSLVFHQLMPRRHLHCPLVLYFVRLAATVLTSRLVILWPLCSLLGSALQGSTRNRFQILSIFASNSDILTDFQIFEKGHAFHSRYSWWFDRFGALYHHWLELRERCSRANSHKYLFTSFGFGRQLLPRLVLPWG